MPEKPLVLDGRSIRVIHLITHQRIQAVEMSIFYACNLTKTHIGLYIFIFLKIKLRLFSAVANLQQGGLHQRILQTTKAMILDQIREL